MDEKLREDTFIPRLGSVISNYNRNFQTLRKRYCALLEEKNVFFETSTEELEKLLISFLCESIYCTIILHFYNIKNITQFPFNKYIDHCFEMIRDNLKEISKGNIDEIYEQLVSDLKGYF